MLRKAVAEDHERLLTLHQAVAAIPGGVIRHPTEITPAYVEQILHSSINKGLMLVQVAEGDIVASIHAYTPSIQAFRHLLSDLTIVVHPNWQGQGIGRRLFSLFLEEVQDNFPHILRIELFVRMANTPAIRFYESLGFQQEGAQKDKILNAQGQLETPVAMAWYNPNYSA